MAEWTQDASEYLEGYLKQVAALARHQGDDAEDIVSGLRDHIAHEVENDTGEMVDIDSLFEVLATIGTPEEVTSLDTPLRGPSRSASASGKSSAPPPPIPRDTPQSQVPQQVIVHKHRSWASYAVAALIFIVLAVVLLSIAGTLAAIALPSLSRARETARRASCANNLKQIGIILKNFADEHDGSFPPLSEEAGRLMFAPDGVYLDDLGDLSVFICPSSKTSATMESDEAFIDDHSYFYLSHAIASEEEGLAYVAAYGAAARAGEGFEHDFIAADGSVLPRIGKGVPFGLEHATASEIPIMIDKPDNHVPRGGNVLFLDGHVTFMKLGEGFPMTDVFIDALKSIDL